MTQNVLLSLPGLIDLRTQTAGDPEICIAVVDSRVDFSHPSLAGAQLEEIVPAWLSSRMAQRSGAHGTHVASIIFGQPGGQVEGIAPRCRGIVIPVYGENAAGELMPCSQEDLARAISLALEAGAHLINISGGELIAPGDVDVFLSKIARSCEQQGAVVVAATGNEGCECLHAPASLPTVLAVGASDARGLPLPFSNWDESLASHGVLAPGEQIQGAVPGGGVAPHNGTSFACPIVTGVAALLLSRQKLGGEKPDPRAVRDAIVASAIPCTAEEQATCERMLGGRLNPRGAYETLFGAAAPSGVNHGARLSDVIRSPPAGLAPAMHSPSSAYQHFSIYSPKEDAAMTNDQVQGPFHAGTGFDARMVAPAGVQPQGCGCPSGQPQQGLGPSQQEGAPAVQAVAAPQSPGAVPQPAMPAHQNMPAAYPNAAPPQQGAMPMHQNMAPAPAQQAPMPMYQSAAPAYHAPGYPNVMPMQQASMPGYPPQAYGNVMPMQQASVPGYSPQAYGNVMPMQQPSAPAYHGGIPAASPMGAHPAMSPVQRTAMVAAYPGPAVHSPMSMLAGGVAPSQAGPSGCPCPLPNDFISAENSQLVYCIGTLGYDFITDARRDYFVQQLNVLSQNSAYIDLFKETLGLQSGVTYYPEDHRAMAAYLYQGSVGPPLPAEFVPDARARASDTGSIVWVLFQENQPLYALRPLQTFAPNVLEEFANFLFNQSRPTTLLGADGKELTEGGKKPTNPNHADRVSIAGRIIGDITLYNGQRVPVLDVSLRALYQWTIELLLKDLSGEHPEVLDTSSTFYTSMDNFLQRIYYEVRNLGQAPSDRAINFMATQIFETAKIFKDAVSKGLVLDSLSAEKSPLCRPKSDCWDVVMRFFNPANRMGQAVEEYRLTADVNDISPVQIGDVRNWARYA